MFEIRSLKKDSLCQVFLERIDVSSTLFNIHGLALTMSKYLKKILSVQFLYSHSFIFLQLIQMCLTFKMIDCFWKHHWYLIIRFKFSVYYIKLAEKKHMFLNLKQQSFKFTTGNIVI